MDYNL